MSSPQEPQQPDHQQSGQPQHQQPHYPQYPQQQYQQPQYQQQQYGQYDPYGQQQYPGYGQQWSQQPSGPPRRPGVLTAAGVLWLINGALLLLFGAITAVADRLPGFEEAMEQQGTEVSTSMLRNVGLAGVAFGIMMILLAIKVFGGETWARILIVVVAIGPALLLMLTVIFPLMVIVAAVLQFLPAAGKYARQRREHSSPA